MRTFFAVLAALLVFGAVVLGVQAMQGPSADECYEQQIAHAASGGALEVDGDC